MKPDRTCAVAAAAAHDLNNDLTVILSSATSLMDSFEPGDPARSLLVELQCAAQRCAWKASGLLNYTARHGLQPAPTPFDYLVDG